MAEENYFPLLDELEREPSHARKNDPITSRVANINIKQASFRALILKTIHLAGDKGLASFEVAEKLGYPRDYVSPHFAPLERLGYLSRSGNTRVNPKTKNRTKSEVWVVTDKYKRTNLARDTKPLDPVAVLGNKLKTYKIQIDNIEKNIEQLVKTLLPWFTNQHCKILFNCSHGKCENSPIGLCVVQKIGCTYCNRHH